MKMMTAVTLENFGSPNVLKLSQVPQPQWQADDVLIRVRAVGVNPVDWKIRAGIHPLTPRIPLPAILGWDVSGVITAVGENVTQYQVGDEVYTRCNIFRPGGYAEYIAVDAQEIACKPKNISHEEAAVVSMAALLAWQCLFDVGNLQAKQRVLIHAAAGGMGHIAVQIAKNAGAYVIGTASARNNDFLTSMGADEIVDYTAVNFEEVIDKVDLVYDLVGGETMARSWQVIKEGGTLVTIVRPEPHPDLIKKYNVNATLVVVKEDGAQLAQTNSLIESGAVKPYVGQILPLAEAAQAHQLNQSGHTRGKIVLKIG